MNRRLLLPSLILLLAAAPDGHCASPARARIQTKLRKAPTLRKAPILRKAPVLGTKTATTRWTLHPSRVRLVRAKLLARKDSSLRMKQLRTLFAAKTLDRSRLAATLAPLVKGKSDAERREILLALSVDLKETLRPMTLAKVLKVVKKPLNIPRAQTADEVRNKRQEFETMFENFDQKANQLFNILSTVLKSMKETRSNTARNML